MKSIAQEEPLREGKIKNLVNFSHEKRRKTDENTQKIEEKQRLEQLKHSKQKFIAELKRKQPHASDLSLEKRMRALVERSELLAEFMISKHRLGQQGRQAENYASIDEFSTFANKSRNWT